MSLQPFHLAIPVHDLSLARAFYGELLGFTEGRSANTWVDYNFHGHQLVCHLVGADYRGRDYFNPVDRDEVPVPHFGICLTVVDFHELSAKLQDKVKFVIPPKLRFRGEIGEQWTMFFKDPSGNNCEFKAMTNPINLFAKYVVKE